MLNSFKRFFIYLFSLFRYAYLDTKNDVLLIYGLITGKRKLDFQKFKENTTITSDEYMEGIKHDYLWYLLIVLLCFVTYYVTSSYWQHWAIATVEEYAQNITDPYNLQALNITSQYYIVN